MAVTEWSQGLAGLTGEQIKKGLDNLTDGWPPSLPEFRAACLNKQVNGFGLDYRPEYYRNSNIIKPEKRLSSTDRDKKRKDNIAELSKLRASIK